MANENTVRKFSHTPELAAKAAARSGSLNVRRSGILPLCIGASRIMRGSDNVKRQYEARELRVEAARAHADGRQLVVGLTCFECRRTYATQEEFNAEHSHSAEDMKQNDEAHTWAYWCEDKYDPKALENIESLTIEIKALKQAHRQRLQDIAKQTDVEAMIKMRESAEKIKGLVEDAERKKAFEEQNIIGLMSEKPFA